MKLKPLDYLILLLCAAVIAGLWYRLTYTVVYDWDWSAIPSFFLYNDPETGYRQNILMIGLLNMVRIIFYAGFFALIFGLGLALMRVSRRAWLRWIARLIVDFIRNIPPLVFLFLFYFFISDMLFPLLGIRDFAAMLAQWDTEIFFGNPAFIENLIAGVLCLSLFEAAYISEIFRAGIESIGKDQREGARAIGLTHYQEMRLIVLPQSLRKVIPPLVGQGITLIKNTSIMSVISIQELTFAGSEIVISSGRIFEVWITVAAVYFCICFALSHYARRLEKAISS